MKIDVLTIFPDFFNDFKNTSINKRAIEKGCLDFNTIDIRDFTSDKHRRIDDRPVGGGNGLIMKVEPIVKAIRSVKKENSKVIYMSPRGNKLDQQKVRSLSLEEHLIIICGHYEGVDERVLDYVDEQISIGDYILSGGEVAASVLSDAVIRLLDGVIKEESHLDESFENGLLEYPQFTIPKTFENKEIPEILYSGNHQAINKWRQKESLKITLKHRKDLFDKYTLTKEDKELIEEIKEGKIGTWEKKAIANNPLNEKGSN